MELQRKRVDDRIEEKILTGLIVSDSFCRNIVPVIKNDTFSSPYIKQVSTWCVEHYKKYEKAPFSAIQDIFELEHTNLKKEDRELISIFLERLAEEYSNENQEINSEYLQDLAINYIRKRSLSVSANRIELNLEAGDIDAAEQEIENYNRVYVDTSGWIDPFDKESIKNYFQTQKENKNDLFSFPGALGKMVGNFQRNWLCSFLAPVKKGKTFWELETGILASLEMKKTAIFSLEMNEHRIKDRLFKRVLAQSNKSADYIYPCFDCLKNQNGSCNKAARTNSIPLLINNSKPSFNRDLKYRVCTACRGKDDFKTGYWFTSQYREKMKQKQTTLTLEGFNKILNRSIRIKSYPAYSANVSRIKADLEVLENSKDFYPDVIIIDYADILAPEDSRITGRERTDETWKMLKNLSDERHCLVVTASQANRASFKKRNVTQIDVSEDIRKMAHVDMCISLNQTPEEKRASITRMNVIAKRDGDFDEYESCIVLQQFALGQVLLDSEMEPFLTEE